MLLSNLNLQRQLDSILQVLDDILQAPSSNLEEACQLLRAAQNNVRTINKKAEQIRITYLEELAANLDAVDDEKAALIQKRIAKAEEIKRMYIKLCRYMNPKGRSSLNHIMIPNNNLPPCIARLWRSICDPVLLEALILEKNRKHFSQAKGTPFTKDILNTIPFSGTGLVSKSILNGTMQVKDPIVQLVLDNLKIPVNVLTIPAAITLDEMTSKFNNWKEMNSTSPTTKRHLGHCQCLIRLIDKTIVEEDEPDPLILRAKKMLNAHFLLVAYSVKFSILLMRWQNVVNSIIEKEPGNPKMHRLRVIHLYEADNNLILGIFWAYFGHASWSCRQRCYGFSIACVTAVAPASTRSTPYSLKNSKC